VAARSGSANLVLMESNRQKLGAASLLLLLAVSVGGFILGRLTHSLAAQAGLVLGVLGFLVAAICTFQMRLEEQERLEKLEYDELNRAAPAGSSLFTTDPEALRARRTREQFEKYIIPALTVLLLIGEVTGAVLLWRALAHPASEPPQDFTLVMAVFGLFGLLLFMLGKYVTGIVRLEGHRLLRPVAGFLLLSAYTCVAVTGAAAAEWAEFHGVDLWVARAFTGVLGLIGAETLAGLVFEMYRPRVKGRVGRLLYDSRLVGLLSQPESLVTALAHALDYQFGFKVSETWFYRSLEKALAWVVLVQLGILALSTMFVVIEPGEQALLERLGKPVNGREVLGSGLHLKWPWPVDCIYRYPAEQLQSFTIGIVANEKEDEPALLWTIGHAKEEFNLLVASRESLAQTNLETGLRVPPVNLLAVNIPVQYQITNLLRWAYGYTEAGALLEQIATREVVHYLVNADIHELMTTHLGQAGQELRERIQAATDKERLGARIVFVGVAGIHPPVDVAHAYERVVGARQEASATLLAAQAHRLLTNALAGAAAYRTRQEAEAERLRLERDALARAAAFTNQIPAYVASPAIYESHALLQIWARSGGDARKYVLATTNTHDVLQYNLEDKLRLDLLDATAPAAPASGSK
jgi:modulator of FtsH protease HflK